MRDCELYAKILGIVPPWSVTDVQLDLPNKEVVVTVSVAASATLHCPECSRAAGGYDSRPRRWRHLDTCQLRTILSADVPRVSCSEHGVRQIAVPWAEANSRFTALFECLVIDWLKEASIDAVARQLGLSWEEADGIQSRAVRRGLARRRLRIPRAIGVDETSFQKRHEYVTVVSDLDGGTVLHVADHRKTESLAGFYEKLRPAQRERIEVAAMDMWEPYIQSTAHHLPHARIAFDKFHVAKHLGDAVDKVRRRESRELQEAGDTRLVGTKYLWLKHPDNISREQWTGTFQALRNSDLRVARAWALKENAMGLWRYRSAAWAFRGWAHWLSWVKRCRLEPMKAVGRMIESHLGGIVNAIVLYATNAMGESLNSKIQRVKRLACGFRNRERFRNAIYFHLGGLTLYPRLPS